MDQFVGLDVSQELTHLCVVDSNGTIVWQGKCDSTPEAIAESVKAKAPLAARIGLESGALSTWHWHALDALGLPVICLDARHARAALSMQVNKTDKNDAHGLAQIVRTGWYREVGVKSLGSHKVRSMLGARAQLVAMRTRVINHLRGIVKTFGIVIGSTGGRAFERRVDEIARGDGMLEETLRTLLTTLRHLTDQIQALDKRANQYAKGNKVCRHLMTIPGVGKLTAAAFVTAVDDPAKFRKSKTVGAYFGLTPRRYQSGETDINGRISKCGDTLARSYLFEAAGIVLSPISLAEIVYLVEKNRLPASAYADLKIALADPEYVIEEAPFNGEVVEAMLKVSRSEVPDMPDRIVAATGIHLGVPVISRDGRIRSSSVNTIW